mmetsp:Transcript_10356/g.13467  ORF Transcript_10356/g.13467 Transcript_10356/m.13467 type:complete len:728 (-) Transcript_10356:1383-3566(-)
MEVAAKAEAECLDDLVLRHRNRIARLRSEVELVLGQRPGIGDFADEETTYRFYLRHVVLFGENFFSFPKATITNTKSQREESIEAAVNALKSVSGTFEDFDESIDLFYLRYVLKFGSANIAEARNCAVETLQWRINYESEKQNKAQARKHATSMETVNNEDNGLELDFDDVLTFKHAGVLNNDYAVVLIKPEKEFVDLLAPENAEKNKEMIEYLLEMHQQVYEDLHRRSLKANKYLKYLKVYDTQSLFLTGSTLRKLMSVRANHEKEFRKMFPNCNVGNILIRGNVSLFSLFKYIPLKKAKIMTWGAFFKAFDIQEGSNLRNALLGRTKPAAAIASEKQFSSDRTTLETLNRREEEAQKEEGVVSQNLDRLDEEAEAKQRESVPIQMVVPLGGGLTNWECDEFTVEDEIFCRKIEISKDRSVIHLELEVMNDVPVDVQCTLEEYISSNIYKTQPKRVGNEIKEIKAAWRTQMNGEFELKIAQLKSAVKTKKRKRRFLFSRQKKENKDSEQKLPIVSIRLYSEKADLLDEKKQEQQKLVVNEQVKNEEEQTTIVSDKDSENLKEVLKVSKQEISEEGDVAVDAESLNKNDLAIKKAEFERSQKPDVKKDNNSNSGFVIEDNSGDAEEAEIKSQQAIAIPQHTVTKNNLEDDNGSIVDSVSDSRDSGSESQDSGSESQNDNDNSVVRNEDSPLGWFDTLNKYIAPVIEPVLSYLPFWVQSDDDRNVLSS